jgi:secreted trypsin-like serine protease
MKSLSLFVATLAVVGAVEQCGVPGGMQMLSGAENYILGGDEATPGELPWQISVQRQEKDGEPWLHTCGGSIIDKNWILTAAHCVDTRILGMVKLRVVLGAHNIRESEPSAHIQEVKFGKDVAIMPMWEVERIDYDYALIQLPQPLDFAGNHSHLGPICLPNATDVRAFENKTCFVSGWGLTRRMPVPDPSMTSPTLQKLPVYVPTHEQCATAWMRGGVANGAVRLTPRHICAATLRGEGSGVCQGDSGGPLQCLVNGRFVLGGVASFVRYCGSNAYPNVYARVTQALDWIQRVRANRTRKP